MGLMGRGLAISLIRAGNNVSGFDAYPEAAESAAKADIPQVSQLHEIANLSTIVLALPDSPDVKQVVRELLNNTQPGTLIIDCSTIDPIVTTTLSEEAAAIGVRFRDAGMGGGPADAAEDAPCDGHRAAAELHVPGSRGVAHLLESLARAAHAAQQQRPP